MVFQYALSVLKCLRGIFAQAAPGVLSGVMDPHLDGFIYVFGINDIIQQREEHAGQRGK